MLTSVEDENEFSVGHIECESLLGYPGGGCSGRGVEHPLPEL